MQQHSLYFLNAKCMQNSYIKDHCESQVWLSSPYADTCIYLLTFLPCIAHSFLKYKSRAQPTNIWLRKRQLRSCSLRTALPQDSTSSWNCLCSRLDSSPWSGDKSSTTHFNLNYRISLTHLRSSQPMFHALQLYSHSCLLDSHSKFYLDFSITHPTSEDSSAFHD